MNQHRSLQPQPVAVLRGTAAVNSLDLDREARIIMAADSEGSVCLWSRKTQRREASFVAHTEGILSLAFLDEGKSILTQGREGSVCIWDTEQPTKQLLCLQVAPLAYGFCRCAVLFPNGPTEIAVLNTQGEIQEWDLRSAKPVSTYSPSSDKQTGLCMCLRYIVPPDGKRLLAGSYENGECYFWKQNTASPFFSSALHTEPALSLDFAERKGNLCGLSGGADTSVILFNVDVEQGSGTPVDKIVLNHGGVSDVKVRSDRKLFASAGWDKRVRLFAWNHVKPLAILKHHTAAVNCLSFSPVPNDNLLVCGSADGRISCWELF